MTALGFKMSSCARVSLGGVLLSAALSLVLPAHGRAGTYTVSACRAGWTPEFRRTSTGTTPAAYDYCDLVEHGLAAQLAAPAAR